MIAVIQDVHLTWTKQSRSGPQARLRNAAADRYVLPALPPVGKSLTVVLHAVSLDEASGYAPIHDMDTVAWSPGRVHRIPGLAIRVADDAVIAEFAWEWEVGAPERSTERRRVLTIRPGAWGSAAWNGRYTTLLGLDGWKYHQHVVNIALMDAPALDPFAGEPARSFRSLADLR